MANAGSDPEKWQKERFALLPAIFLEGLSTVLLADLTLLFLLFHPCFIEMASTVLRSVIS